MTDARIDALAQVFDTVTHAFVQAEARPMPSGLSLLSEMCARHVGAAVGVFRMHATVRERTTNALAIHDVLVKVKAADTVLLDAGTELAARLEPSLGPLYARWSPLRELGRSHLREVAIYRDAPPAVRAWMPHLHGVVTDTTRGLWISVIEYLDDVDLLADMGAVDHWTDAHFASVTAALADLHAAHFGASATLLSAPWIARNAEGGEVLRMNAWWEAIAQLAARAFAPWFESSVEARQRANIEALDGWWSELCAMPRTLIHNDFNPRNLAFRRTTPPRVCVYDWELATLGVPQHDLAELLVFALPTRADPAWVDAIVAAHHRALESRVGWHWTTAEWRRGVALSLDHLLLDRLPMYALQHLARPLPYLEQVVRNWQRLRAWIDA